MVALTLDARRRLLGWLLVLGLWGVVSGGPIVGAPQALVQRQLPPSTQSTATTATGVATTTPTRVSQTQAASASITPSSATVSATISTSAATTNTASTQTTSANTSRVRTRSSASSSLNSSTQSATSTSAAVTATTTVEPSIFSSSSKYFGYAVGVLVVVCVFGSLLLILFIRFIVQLFTKKPRPPPINTTNRAWRYSQDSDIDSAGPIPTSANPTTQSDLGPRHKDLDTSEMGERRAFLSTDSVTLYPVGKSDTESQRYQDDSGRTHMRSFSSSSGSGTGTVTPYVSRRPVSMSFLHSPPATHPAFVVDHGSQSGHSAEGGVEPTPQPQPHLLQAVPETNPDMNSLLLARAIHSDAYRQQTRSATGLSRAASTASAYSIQPPASIPPVPEVPPAWMLSGRGLQPDIANALTTMRGRTGSMDSVLVPEGTTAPPTEEGAPPTRRMMSGPAGWGRQAQTSINGGDLHFGRRP